MFAEPLGSLWEPSGNLWEPPGSLWELLGAFIRANCVWHEVLKGLVRPMISKSSCFTRILLRFGRCSKTNGRAYLLIYRVSVKYNGFGVVREFSALPSILVFLGFKLMKPSCF